MTNEKCPICDVPLTSETCGAEMDCPDCKRTWEWTDFQGEKTLASKRRPVRIDYSELREGGDIQKLIRPQ